MGKGNKQNHYDKTRFLPTIYINFCKISCTFELLTKLLFSNEYSKNPLAAILSANGEWNPIKTWNINLNGLLAILELAREKEMDKIFFPSTIAVFG